MDQLAHDFIEVAVARKAAQAGLSLSTARLERITQHVLDALDGRRRTIAREYPYGPEDAA